MTALDRRRTAGLVDWLARRLRLDLPARGGYAELTILVTDDAGIRAADRRCFGRDLATDVIACRYEPMPGEPVASGEIIVNLERASRVAPAGWSAARELALYLAHGLDHLTGADDATSEQRMRMRRRELRLLRLAGRARIEPILRASSRAPARRSGA